MKNITVPVDEGTYRLARIRVAEPDEVTADFATRGVGLRSSDNLTRDELYDEAISGSKALR